MRESRTYGSVRGALSNGRPYRDRGACHRARIRATRSLAMTVQHLNCLCCLKLDCRHCEEHLRRSDPCFLCAARWIGSRSLSSGAHLRDPVARNDGSTPELSLLFEIRLPSLRGALATKQSILPYAARWIASRSLSSGAHSRDPLARNDGSTPEL